MKYKHDIIDKILEELRKIPNIRYACSKIGIDHSTYYRWMLRHPTFRKRVLTAMHVGKSNISAIAEATIINGVNNGDYKSSVFWLSHNELQYMQREKADHQWELYKYHESVLREKIILNGKNFESLFVVIELLEKSYEQEVFDHLSQSIISKFCDNDQELIEVCKAVYQSWKIEKKEQEDRENEDIEPIP